MEVSKTTRETSVSVTREHSLHGNKRPMSVLKKLKSKVVKLIPFRPVTK